MCRFHKRSEARYEADMSNSQIAVGRIVSVLVVAGGWLFAGTRLMLDLIGYATVPEDARVASNLLDRFLLWTLELPWFVPWGFAALATIWLMYVSWPRSAPLAINDPVDGGTFGPEPAAVSATPSGDTLVATATISDPSPGVQLSRTLYTGWIHLSDTALEREHYLEAIIVAFNGSAKTLIVESIKGGLKTPLMGRDNTRDIKTLPTPDLVRVEPQFQIPPFSEFRIHLKQHVSPYHSEQIFKSLNLLETVFLNCEDLQIVLTPHREDGPSVALPLWDGISLSFREGVISNRQTIARAQFSPIKLSFGSQ